MVGKRATKKSTLMYQLILFIAFLIFGLGKFLTSPEEAANIFGKIGGSPIQYFTGVYELLAAILVMVSSTAFIGATLILIAMVGAVFLHIFILGFEGFFLVLFVIAIILIFISLKVMRERRRDLFR